MVQRAIAPQPLVTIADKIGVIHRQKAPARQAGPAIAWLGWRREALRPGRNPLPRSLAAIATANRQQKNGVLRQMHSPKAGLKGCLTMQASRFNQAIREMAVSMDWQCDSDHLPSEYPS